MDARTTKIDGKRPKKSVAYLYDAISTLAACEIHEWRDSTFKFMKWNI